MNSPVLIGCEESQTVCKAFRDKRYMAYSCDLLPTRGNTSWHYQADIMEVIPRKEKWGLIILHPDCTAMATTGNRWYSNGTLGYESRVKAVVWTLQLWELAKKHSKRVALENPVSVIFSEIPSSQYIQPWQFGHGEVKKTGLALHNLPPLEPTNIVDGRNQRVWKMSPGKNRKRDRSKTFLGIAEAMAEQWGAALQEDSKRKRVSRFYLQI